jgi:hypothetical protein
MPNHMSGHGQLPGPGDDESNGSVGLASVALAGSTCWHGAEPDVGRKFVECAADPIMQGQVDSDCVMPAAQILQVLGVLQQKPPTR